MRYFLARRNLWPLLSLFFALVLAACGGTESASINAGGEDASVSVLFTDAPIHELKEVNVSVTQIKLLPSGDGEHITIFSSNPATVIDLLSLTGEATYLGTREQVPAGCYEKVRLEIEAIELVPKDENAPLVLLTGNDLTANGKLNFNPRGSFCLHDGEQVAVQLDMDAEQSIHIVEAGASGKFIVRPVVFIDIIRDDLSGKLVRLSGQVDQIAPDDNAFLLCPPLIAPSSLQKSRSVTECIEVGTEMAAIFDTNGDAVPLSALHIGDAVEVLGRLRLLDPPVIFEVKRAFDAVLVEIGTYQKLSGSLTVGPDALGNFSLALDPGQGFTDAAVLNALLTEDTRIYSSQGEPLLVTDLMIGQNILVDGIYNSEAQILKTALIIVQEL